MYPPAAMDYSESESRPLEMFFLPYLSPGHMIPLSEMARLFAARGEHVTMITTPSNASLLEKFVAKDAAARRRIAVHTVPFPSEKVGLPAGLENFFSVTDLETASKLYRGMTLMQAQIEEFVINRRPDCVVADMFYPWTTALAACIGVPRLVFQATCVFAVAMKDAVRHEDSPHRRVLSDYERFVIPNLPHPISMTRSQLPDYARTPNGYTQLMEQWRDAELNSFGVLVNNYAELDGDYTEHYKRIMGHTVWHIGPAALIHRNADDKVERGHKTVVGQAECLSWLDSKQPNSVLYICFGSACRFPDDQLFELACGLEAAGHRFMWVVFGKEDENENPKWLPETPRRG